MTLSLAVESGKDSARLSWSTDQGDPAGGWSIQRCDVATGGVACAPAVTIVTLSDGEARAYNDLALDSSRDYYYEATDLSTPEDSAVEGPINPTGGGPRYVDKEEVKTRLGIQGSDEDDAVDLFIATAATYVDSFAGTSFADAEVWPTVPEGASRATLTLAVRYYKRPDMPFGVAGSPDLVGEINLSETDPDIAQMLASLRKRYPVA